MLFLAIVAALCPFNMALSAKPSGWQWITPPLGTDPLNDAAFGPAGFVMVCGDGSVRHSVDGLAWTPAETGVLEPLLAVVANSQRYVATGKGGTVITSVDGFSWNKLDCGTADIMDVVWCGTWFVACDTAGQTWIISGDAATVTQRSTGIHAEFRQLAYGNGMLFAVTTLQDSFVYSRDCGLTWSARSGVSGVTTTGKIEFSCVYYHEGKFKYELEFGNSDTYMVLITTDGSDSISKIQAGPAFHTVVNGTLFQGGVITYGNSRYVRAYGMGVIKSCEDGSSSWVTRTPGWYDGEIHQIHDCIDGPWVVGSKGLLCRLADFEIGNPTFVSDGRTYWDLGTAGGFPLAVDGNGDVSRTLNGLDWTVAASMANVTWTSLAQNGGDSFVGGYESFSSLPSEFGFVMNWYEPRLRYSGNGVDWQPITTHNGTDKVFDIACHAGDGVAVGDSIMPFGTKSITARYDVPETLKAVTFGNNSWVAVGESGWAVHSLDRYHWKKLKLGDENLHAVVFKDGLFFAAGNYGKAFVATNPADWKAVPSGTGVNCTGAYIVGGRLFVSGNYGVLRSMPWDADNDALPDLWEQAHFSSETLCSPDDDGDLDGNSNRLEFSDATSPVDPDSVKYELRIETSGSGSISTQPQGPRHLKGTNVILTPKPDAGSKFAGWQDSQARGLGTRKVAMMRPTVLRARFLPTDLDNDHDGLRDFWEYLYFGVNTSKPEEDTDNDGRSNLDEYRDGTAPNDPGSVVYPFKVLVTGKGSVSASPSLPKYAPGTKVSLTATPAKGWEFVWWRFPLSMTSNPLVVSTSRRHQEVIAVFLPASKDKDGDKLPDYWEMRAFSNLAARPDGDPDRDGNSNWTEFKDGTDPQLAASAKYAVDFKAVGNGYLVASPKRKKYLKGSVIHLKSVPGKGHYHSHWGGAADSIAPEIDFKVDSPARIVGNFLEGADYRSNAVLGSTNGFAGIYKFKNLRIGDSVRLTSKGISHMIIQVEGTLTLGKGAVIAVRNGFYPNAPTMSPATLTPSQVKTGGQLVGGVRVFPGCFGKGGDGGRGANGQSGTKRYVFVGYGTYRWEYGSGGSGGGGGGGGGGFGGGIGAIGGFGGSGPDGYGWDGMSGTSNGGNGGYGGACDTLGLGGGAEGTGGAAAYPGDHGYGGSGGGGNGGGGRYGTKPYDPYVVCGVGGTGGGGGAMVVEF